MKTGNNTQKGLIDPSLFSGVFLTLISPLKARGLKQGQCKRLTLDKPSKHKASSVLTKTRVKAGILAGSQGRVRGLSPLYIGANLLT